MIDPLPLLSPAAQGHTLPPVGATIGENGVTYRVWAPDHREARVLIETNGANGESRWLTLEAEGEGGFSGLDAAGRAGDLYRFELDGVSLPDPASRFQPQGVGGPSQVIDPHAYAWRTVDWRRPPFPGRVIYELHIGAFTTEGTFTAAISRLDALAALGVNTIELMPIGDFPGERNWGYDGVMLFAPARCYGTPDELRALVDAAHTRGLAVILDVVYNHIGPVDNVLPACTAQYFHPERVNVWGRAFNYAAEPVRHFFLQNACQWLDEYRFDGLRLDAVHVIEDESPRHIVAEIVAAAHTRNAWVIAEDEHNDVGVITPARQGGWGVDGAWADDFHHTLRVAMTGEKEAHFKSYTGSITEWVKTLSQGWLYDGQIYSHWKRPRGTPAGHVPPERFVVCISNHDQVGNRPLGDRLHQTVTPEAYRAVSLLLCFSPYTPLLFMGQEWAARTPFPYFADLPGENGANIAANRRKEFAHYGASYSGEVLARMPDPARLETFTSAKLNWDERERSVHRPMLDLYRECLQLRASEEIFQSPARDRWSVRQVGAHFVGIRWTDPRGDWLLLAGVAEKDEAPAHDDPFISNSTADRRWRLVLASNSPAFGGSTSHLSWRGDDHGFVIGLPGAVLLREFEGEAQAIALANAALESRESAPSAETDSSATRPA